MKVTKSTKFEMFALITELSTLNAKADSSMAEFIVDCCNKYDLENKTGEEWVKYKNKSIQEILLKFFNPKTCKRCMGTGVHTENSYTEVCSYCKGCGTFYNRKR